MTIAVFGCKGRVGSAVVKIAEERGHTVYGIDRDLKPEITCKVDAVIDFSAAKATKEVCEFCQMHRCPLITGTTGRNAEQNKTIEELKQNTTVIEKANFSRGIEILLRLVKLTAELLPDFDCEIVETHKRNKSDSPSGTSKQLAAQIVKGKGSFSKVTIHSLRCGTNFGEHSIVFGGNGESVTLTHRAESPEIYAQGAIRTAEELLQTTAHR